MFAWRCEKIIVKDIGTNERGEPTINGKDLLKYRLLKKENLSLRLELLKESLEIKCPKCGAKYYHNKSLRDKNVCPQCGNDVGLKK